jgi:two-component system, OmpR family, response regulator
MREGDLGQEPQRSLATRRLEMERGAPSSLVEPIWDPNARLQPMVIVVDDSPAVRSVVRIALERERIPAVTFPDGLDLMAALRDGEIAPPKVLLLDIVMPRMGGYRVARALRSNPGFQSTKVFMMTGYDGMLNRALSAVLRLGFIRKPFKSPEMVRTVREALGMRPVEDRWP